MARRVAGGTATSGSQHGVGIGQASSTQDTARQTPREGRYLRLHLVGSLALGVRSQTEGAGRGQFLPSPGYCGAFLRGRMVLGDRAGRSLIMSSLVRLLSALILLLAAADA